MSVIEAAVRRGHCKHKVKFLTSPVTLHVILHLISNPDLTLFDAGRGRSGFEIILQLYTLMSFVIFFFSNKKIKVSVKENELPMEKNSRRASIFATKASNISI